MKFFTVLTVMMTIMSSVAFADLREFQYKKVECHYQIVNGPSEKKWVYAAFNSNSPYAESNEVAVLTACAGFFTEAGERLNPKRNLAVTLTVGGQEIKGNHY